MANCLYECLREAGLEQYYPNFEASGITRSEGLTALTMQEYSDYGIDDMDDRKRLFQLIQIIKNVQKNGKRCGQSCDNEYDDRTPRSTNHYDDECNDTTPRFTNRTDNDCESRMPRLTNRRSSIESDSSDDDLQQVYNSCAKQYAPIILNNGVLDKKFIRNNNNNIMRATSFDKLDKKPDVFFVKTSPKKSKSKSYSSALYQSLSDSETLEANVGNSYHGPKLKERSIERIKYSGMQYDYGVPSTNRKFTPTSNSTSTPTRPSTDSALTEDRIKVCIRKRPLNKKEKRNKEADVITVENPNKVVLDENKTAVDLTKFTQMHEFYFDEVFDENQTNEQIYEKTAKPLVNCIFRGGKATCFAYGQTGAGKTHTMLGNGKVQGLYLLAAKDIFSVLQSGYHGRSLSVWISYFEIYCGQLFDLLNARKRLHAREDGKNNVCIAGIKEFQIGNVAALMEVIEYGNQVRSTGVSGVNSDSSRSHAILQIQLKDRAKRKLGRFSFIDLAGSERAADTNDPDRLTRIEGAEINTSLLALKECIRAIDQEQRHTPFRQSKLTHILKDSFLGESRTCMIANISPNINAGEHTLNTLRYANRVKELKKDSVPSSSGINPSTGLPRTPSTFTPTNTSTPKRRPKPLALTKQAIANWELPDYNAQSYAVPKTRSPRKESKSSKRKNTSPEEDDRRVVTGDVSSRISIGHGDGEIRVVKYTPDKPSSEYFSTPVSSRISSQAAWEIDNPRFAGSPPRKTTSAKTSPAKSESGARLGIDNLRSEGALRKSKEFWVARNDSSSVRNLLMDSSPEEPEREQVADCDVDSENTDSTSEIIRELDKILEQSWIRNSSSGNSTVLHPTEVERLGGAGDMSRQAATQILANSSRSADMKGLASRPVCDLRVPEKPDVEQRGYIGIEGDALEDMSLETSDRHHRSDAGKMKVAKKSRKRWVADSNISHSLAREIEGLPSPKDFLKSLAKAKLAEKQKQESPKKTSPSGVIVSTNFQECFMPSKLKYTPEPSTDAETSVAGSPRQSVVGAPGAVAATVVQDRILDRPDQSMPQSNPSRQIEFNDTNPSNNSIIPVVKPLPDTEPHQLTQREQDAKDRNTQLSVLTEPQQLDAMVSSEQVAMTTTITTITTTVSTTTIASPRQPDSNQNFHQLDITYQTQTKSPLKSSPDSAAKSNIIKLSPGKETSPRPTMTGSKFEADTVSSMVSSEASQPNNCESSTPRSPSAGSSQNSEIEKTELSPTISDIVLSPSSNSAFTLVQPKPKPIKVTGDPMPKVKMPIKQTIPTHTTIDNSPTVTQASKSTYFSPVRKEYLLACSFPQDELRNKLSNAIASSSVTEERVEKQADRDKAKSSMFPERKPYNGQTHMGIVPEDRLANYQPHVIATPDRRLQDSLTNIGATPERKLSNGQTLVGATPERRVLSSGQTLISATPKRLTNGQTLLGATPERLSNGQTLLGATPERLSNGQTLVGATPERRVLSSGQTLISATPERLSNGQTLIGVTPERLTNGQTLVGATPERTPLHGETTPGRTPLVNRRDSALAKAQDLMLSAHEEEIIEMSQLSEREYHLIQQVKSGDKDFSQFVHRLDELLSSKMRCIETLRSQLETFSMCAASQKTQTYNS